MSFDKVDTIVVLNHAILTEFILTFNTHAILCQHPLNITIIFFDILSDIINPLLVDFPTAVRIDFTARHNIRLIEMLWQEGTVWMFSKTRRHNAQRLVVVDSKEINYVLANEF